MRYLKRKYLTIEDYLERAEELLPTSKPPRRRRRLDEKRAEWPGQSPTNPLRPDPPSNGNIYRPRSEGDWTEPDEWWSEEDCVGAR